ncbi:molybdopterin molybdotransferase MoeA [Campylobacter porcelli]|uniref:Molybdopterin molybdenumtransferase n=1 Tax=Campylobacter porcelli TaxID=1660073 RepID=A0A1X9SUK1_9BACT|nr:molybdopterin molybdotransferase MoeA [Campylobacter sp. RM6137]ARQ99924.1 molybdopterin molybdenumtransferase [Campylobacter sp. RM6137]
MKSYNENLQNLLNLAPKWDFIERVSLDRALGRILADDIVAKSPYPAYPTSSMDGYAIKFTNQNNKIKVINIAPAGSSDDIAISENECVKTLTGALVCNGADTIVPIENVKLSGEYIEIIKPVSQGFAIREVGESYKESELLLSSRTKLGYCELALLAELGHSYVNVLVAPRVAILSTGSEILDIGQNKEHKAQIYSSNSISISSLVRDMGCEPIIMPIIKDDKEAIKNALFNALNSADFIITTGGVSVGDFDFMKEIAREAKIIIDGVAIKPGRHIKVAKINDKFIFALPGFAYSAIVTCVLFFKEFIGQIFGVNTTNKFKAILKDDYIKRSPFEEFSAATITNENGTLLISTKSKKIGSSAIIGNLSNGAVLMRVPSHKDGLKASEVVEYIKI